MNKDNLATYFKSFSSFFARGGGIGRAVIFTSLLLIFLVVLYYFIGMGVIHKIDDAADFQPSQSNPGESKTIAMAISLINREVNENGWVAIVMLRRRYAEMAEPGPWYLKDGTGLTITDNI